MDAILRAVGTARHSDTDERSPPAELALPNLLSQIETLLEARDNIFSKETGPPVAL
jgi:hypothetical protein